MCTYICICVYSIRMCIYTYIHTKPLYICMYSCYVCAYVYMYVCMYACTIRYVEISDNKKFTITTVLLISTTICNNKLNNCIMRNIKSIATCMYLTIQMIQQCTRIFLSVTE